MVRVKIELTGKLRELHLVTQVSEYEQWLWRRTKAQTRLRNLPRTPCYCLGQLAYPRHIPL